MAAEAVEGVAGRGPDAGMQHILFNRAPGQGMHQAVPATLGRRQFEDVLAIFPHQPAVQTGNPCGGDGVWVGRASGRNYWSACLGNWANIMPGIHKAQNRAS